MNAGAMGSTPNTPKVFCAVNAVIAVAANAPSMVTVLMSAWMPAPPPESEPATIRTRPFIGYSPALLRRLGGRAGRGFDLFGAAGDGQDRLANVVDDARQQPLVLAL